MGAAKKVACGAWESLDGGWRDNVAKNHVMQTSDPGFEIVPDVIRRDELSTMAPLLDSEERGRAGRRHALAVIAAVLILPVQSATTAAQSASAVTPRLSLGLLVGSGSADTATIACCELRTPPQLRTLEESSFVAFAGFEARWHLNPRTTTFFQVERSPRSRAALTFARPAPAPPPPFATYEATRDMSYRHVTFTAGQVLELARDRRLRPRAFASIGLRRAAEGQTSTSVLWATGTTASTTRYDWHRKQILFSAGGGVSARIAAHAFISADLAWSFWSITTCGDCDAHGFRTDALVEPRPVALRFAAGVLF